MDFLNYISVCLGKILKLFLNFYKLLLNSKIYEDNIEVR